MLPLPVATSPADLPPPQPDKAAAVVNSAASSSADRFLIVFIFIHNPSVISSVFGRWQDQRGLLDACKYNAFHELLLGDGEQGDNRHHRQHGSDH
ncbi:hypothetical protein D3C75_977900 [compost metagenome]